MERPIMNSTVLVSDPKYYSVVELNTYSHQEVQPNRERAKREHALVVQALQGAGVTVVQEQSPTDCQDGVYVANWAFCSGNTAVMSRLPGPRHGEQVHAAALLSRYKSDVIIPPYRFSGQGDALACGDTLFVGGGYRSDPRMANELQQILRREYQVQSVQTVPLLEDGKPVVNKLSGWPDSKFYDIDLAIGVLKPDMIAWCPDAFTFESQDTINNLAGIKKIEVSWAEATQAFACNLVSTGETVIMSAGAPKFEAALGKAGLQVVSLSIPELQKGGGSARCVTLAI